MVDKLLTLKEAADSLGLSEEEVRRLVKKGDIPAYQIGGMYLRFKEEQILSIKKSGQSKAGLSESGKNSRQPSGKEGYISRIRDSLYFNDFYIAAAVLVAILIYLIARSIR
ncbi:MAG: helix-turn-helix domain-containing protein [Candidatus Omnitrophica bacterium]|nr:helix-turn-helix domain-containing protein [Candidatus Omnitrophota bacterium]